MNPPLLVFRVTVAIVVSLPVFLLAVPGEEGPIVSTPESDRDGIELPVWRDNEFHESFDIRIWPEATVVWLEQENLRELIADPATPDEERFRLKRILALQNAWRPSKASDS